MRSLSPEPEYSIEYHQSPPPFIFRHTLFLLPAFVAASLLIILLTFLIPLLYRLVSKLFAKPEYQPILLDDDEIEESPPTISSSMPSHGLVSDFRAHIRSLQEYGSILFALEVLRTLCLCALLGLSIYAAVKADSPMSASKTMEFEITKSQKKNSKHKGKKHKAHHDKSTVDDYSSLEWGEFGVCAFYVCLIRIYSQVELMLADLHPPVLLPHAHAPPCDTTPTTTHRSH